MADLNVALRVVARDLGSREVRRAITEIDRATQQSARTQQRTVAVAGRATRREFAQNQRAAVVLAQRQTQSARQSNSVILRDAQRLHQAREHLGIRSERSIQREILRTVASYQRLAQSGRLSGQELSRAADAATHKIRRLQGEMRRTSTASGGLGKGLMAVGGGILAGAAVARGPISTVMDYEKKIALISNTAYAKRDVAGRQAGQAEIKAAISRAVQTAGGTIEGAANTLYELLGASGLSRDQAFEVLPHVQRFGLATGRDGGTDLSGLIGALKAQGIAPENMADALGKMLHAGQTGGFGVDNMIAILPRLLQAQRDNFGVNGVAGLEAALANMTGIVAANGMPQESGQSLIGLLNTLKNPAINQAVAEKLSIGGRAVDLQGTLAKGVAAGVDPLETFAATIDQALVSNKGYQKLKAKLGSGSGNSSDVDALSTLLENTVLRDVGIGRGELVALSAYLKNREAIATTRADYATRGAAALDASGAVIQATASERLTALDQRAADARQRTLAPLTDTIGDVAAKLADYANQYPGLTASLVGATDAIKVMTAAALVFGGIKMLSGGKLGGVRNGGNVSKPSPSLGIQNASGVVAKSSVANQPGTTGSVFSVLGKGVKRAVPGLVLGEAAIEGINIVRSDASGQYKAIASTQLAGQTAGAGLGAWGGSVAGGLAGSVVPIIGTSAGVVIGGLAGAFGGGAFGDWLGEGIGQWIFSGGGNDAPPDNPAIPKTPEEINAHVQRWPDTLQTMSPQDLEAAMQLWREPKPLDVDIKVSVDVQDGNIIAAINEANAREARRH